MSETPPPILAYAATNYAPQVPSSLNLTFERPSANTDAALRCIGAGVAAVAATMLISFAAWRLAREGKLDPIAIAATALGVLAMILIGWWCLSGILRVIRYRNTPITLELTADQIIITDSVQFGPQPRELALAELRRCRQWSDPVLGGGLRSYFIVFHPRSWLSRSTSVRVIVGDKGIVERAAADMQRAIEHARKSV